MNATIFPEKKHYPVLLNEIISIITPQYGGTFIDCTFGQGGYSKKILENKSNKIFAIDRDRNSKKIVLNLGENIENPKGIIFDLGYSTKQIKDPTKGLSFNNKGKLNMKMGLNDFSADDVVNKLGQKELTKVFKLFGEENSSKIISKKIISFRKNKKIQTQDLVNIINSVKKKKYSKTHNATKVFQAIRIIVNNEISELIYGLINSFKLLPVGGAVIIVTFHSIEDRIVKFFLKNYSENKNVSRYLKWFC